MNLEASADYFSTWKGKMAEQPTTSQMSPNHPDAAVQRCFSN